MALQKDELDFLIAMHRRLTDQPLEPDDPVREPIHEELDDSDPVALLAFEVGANPVESLQLFSGFRGAGKTTELWRLRKQLRDLGYLVLYADAMDYVNPAEPIDISDMLMVIAGAFSDTLNDAIGTDMARESFWDRLKNFLTKTEIRIGEAGAKLDYSTPAGAVLGSLKTGVNIKAELKTASSFKQNLQKFLSGHLVDLKAEADAFIEDGVKAIWAARGADTKVVFIFDSLEQLRGSYLTWKDVIQSVQQLFTVHIDRLRLPYVHAIYSVPPWLRYLPNSSPVPITILPTAHLWHNDADRTPDARARAVFRSLLYKRLKPQEMARLFGPAAEDPGGPLDRLIGACTGHVRDLLRLVQEVFKRARSLPIGDDAITSAINAERRALAEIPLDDAKWLFEIGETRTHGLLTADERSVERLSNFLDTHRVAYFVNGESWYDLHPLIREDVARIVARAGAKDGT